MPQRKRSVGSVKNELIIKAKEAAISAISIFNSPQIHFKSETFIVLLIIAWTYGFHAYYRGLKINYRQRDKRDPRLYRRTKYKAIMHWSLEECLEHAANPLNPDIVVNLKLLIGIRHEIEHQMTTSIDDIVSSKFQSCAMNFNTFLKDQLKNKEGLEQNISFSLQFSDLAPKQFNDVTDSSAPDNLKAFLANFEGDLTPEQLNSPSYNYQIFLTRKLSKKPGVDVKTFEFIPHDSELAESLNKTKLSIQEKEKNKRLPSGIVRDIKAAGFPRFSMTAHTKLWKKKNIDFQVQNSPYGVKVVNTWYWYDIWFNLCIEHCQLNQDAYT